MRSTVVLFGRNDSGKTNILEGLEAALSLKYDAGGRRAPPDFPGDLEDAPDSRIEFDLDGVTIPGHPDQKLLVAWWMADDSDEGHEIRDLIEGGHRWDSASERIDRVAEAAARIIEREDLPLDGYVVEGGFFRCEIAGGQGEIDLGELGPDDPPLCATFWMNSEPGVPRWLYDQLNGYIEAELHKRDVTTDPSTGIVTGVLRRDNWLMRDEQGGVHVRDEVDEICEDLAASAHPTSVHRFANASPSASKASGGSAGSDRASLG